jgi:hypothetical protein
MTWLSKNGLAGFAFLTLSAASDAAPIQPRPADPPPAGLSPWAVGARFGTLGGGLEVAAGLTDHLNLRAVGQVGAFSVVGTFDDTDYDVDVDLRNAGLILDVYPAAEGSFRFSAGLFYNGNEYQGTATPQFDTTIGDISFTPAQIGTIHGEVDTGEAAYYVGLGFGNPLGGEGHWTVTLDLGVWVMASAPEIELTADGEFGSEAVFQAELEKEEENVEDDLVQWWPVVMLGLSYRF